MIDSRLSFNCSNFVALQCGHHPDNDWQTCVQAVNDYFLPLDTFGTRFEQLLLSVTAIGYDTIDIWTAGQINPQWSTPEHHRIATDLLSQYHIRVISISGDFGASREAFLASCQLALDMNTDLLAGTTPLLTSDREFVIGTLKAFGLRLGIENHPEKTPDVMLAQIREDSDGHIGTTIDTGWYATQGYSVPHAIEVLREHIFYVHLKDVLPPRYPNDHVNCGYGNGIVPIEACVHTLKRVGYVGVYSIENHCLDHDPTDELKTARDKMQIWLN